LNDDASFWTALLDGRNVVRNVPSERWAVDELRHARRLEPGRSITFAAGVLSRVDEFDAAFFGISPREACAVDPQQRLLLELSWEAMENAGICPSALAGTNCAVYVGISGMDYGTRGMDDLAVMSSHSMTGSAPSIAANRISYFFDFHGPSLSIDTACSSSLVALHHACMCLRSGDASMALVGGVNMLLHPSSFVGFTKAGMLSADGRCKAFDATGDGYVRAEGSAVLLLKPLEKALADGDTIQAVILGSGVNADGARKSGITIPSREGQVELMRGVLAQSGLHPHDVDFIEAHGTGTAVGDPVEASAIGTVYGRGRHAPLPIGSVKTNLGHLESASGMAGLVKAVLVLRHHLVPPSLHCSAPNPHIDFAALNIELVTATRVLASRSDKPLVAGVNSFGFGGANAHVLLREYRREHDAESSPHGSALPPLFLSARTEPALRGMAGRYAAFLRGTPQAELYDVAYSAACGRDRLEKRLALVATSPTDAAAELARYAHGECSSSLLVEDALPESGSVAFVYSGNGAQWLGMGRTLLEGSPRFAEILSEIDTGIRALAGFSVREELLADEPDTRLDDTVVAQPALFAIQVAVTVLLAEYGIKPAAVAGHSVGEVAAAWASGALTLDQAIRVIVFRSAAQGATRGSGTMAAVSLSREAAAKVVSELDGEADVTVAAVNSPHMVTFSGNLDGMARLGEHLKSREVRFTPLNLEYAFHSRHMDAVQGGLLRDLHDLAPASCANAVFVSSVDGRVVDGKLLDARYWWRNVRECVRFDAAVMELVKSGCRIFVEIGPHAILQRYLRDILVFMNVKGRVLSALRKNADGAERIHETALRVHLLADGTIPGAFFPQSGKKVRLPNYPWQHERYWHRTTNESLRAIERRRVHPLLGWLQPGQESAWENVLDPQVVPWLGDHAVGGAVVFPGTAYVEMGLAAARQWLGAKACVLEDLDIVSPMVFDGQHARTVHLALDPRDGGFRICSRQRLSDEPWALHAVGRVQETSADGGDVVLAGVPPSGTEISAETHYRMAKSVGLDYGPDFRGLEYARVEEGRVEGGLRADIPEDVSGYVVHPALMDVCAQSLLGVFAGRMHADDRAALLPVRVGRFVLRREGRARTFRGQVRHGTMRSVLADFDLMDATGVVVASMRGCRFRTARIATDVVPDGAFWRTTSRLRPHPSEECASFLPAAAELAARCHAAVADMEPQRRAWFEEALPMLELLVLAFAREGMEHLERNAPDSMLQLAATPSRYARWLCRLLEGEGLLRLRDGRWELTAAEPLPAARSIWRELLRDFPECLPQLALLGRVGQNLPRLLSGHAPGADFLASLFRASEPESFHENPGYVGVNTAIAGVLGDLASSLPAGRRVRVLEVSAGTSGLAREACRVLAEDRLEYVLAAVDDRLMQRVQAENQELGCVACTILDCAEWTLGNEDCPPGHFDVVIFGHVLHRAPNPHAALARARRWLAPGGALLLAERYPDWCVDFLAGLDDGWWHEGNAGACGDVAPFSSLQPPEVWLQSLRDCGFADTARFTEPAAGDLAEGAYLLLARCARDTAGHVSATCAERWLLVADDASQAVARSLCIVLEARGQHVAVVPPPLPDGMEPDAAHVVFLLGWERPVEDSVDVLCHVQGYVRGSMAGRASPPRLWVVTKGGALASDLPEDWVHNPGQAALWGFGRVVMNEAPTLRCTLVDLGGDVDEAPMAARLADELLLPDGANEIVLAPTGRRTLVLLRDEESAAQGKVERYRLDFHVPGRLRNLFWAPAPEPVLPSDGVEVRAGAVGLNFRDVMYLMGLLPDEAVEKGFAGASLGLEFSGVVTRVGAKVAGMRPGDAVFGFGPACFASHVVTSEHALLHLPDGWSFEAAATVPTVFLTAYYALKQLADVQPGERVLIHGAAGGVGMAAIQLGRHLGAEIFATAGSDVKRDLVRLLGASHVFDSRGGTFADDILAVTEGQGVDVVLNSLSGEAIRRNLRVLKPFGRFLELGKRDFFENTRIGLRPFKDNISYFGIDADQLLTGRPHLAARLLEDVMALFRDGVLAPLPYTAFPAERVVDAFRCMQQARHMGKIVVTLDGRQAVQLPDVAAEPPRFVPETTWLVTGGLGGFGLETARWLAGRGVGNLVLVSRRGPDAPGARDAIAELTERGVNVLALACDVVDAEALEGALQLAERQMPPIRGILHAAMVLDDRLITNMGADSIAAVLQPKLLGAWNLHRLTRALPLEHFVLYSSITTLIGNPGQANYVAANAGLEALARLRRQAGLPAVCIGWGPIGDAGYLTRNVAVRDSLAQRLGGAPLTVAQAMRHLEAALAVGGDAAIATMDWGVLRRFLPSARNSRFERLNAACKDGAQDDALNDFQALAATKTRSELLDMVRGFVLQEVADIFSLGVDRIDPERPLHDAGMDSLMAVELAVGLEKRFGVQFPVMLLNESPSASKVAERIVERLNGEQASERDEAAIPVDDIVRKHGEQLSMEDLERVARDAGASPMTAVGA
jgi:acyl transferase domain-containing protein/NADPH:quinone reductase-like Zn-dependent oxidoreductase/acyl carrier protein/NADP-dependent 3-hydroxy acid dehydrogenase YdfG